MVDPRAAFAHDVVLVAVAGGATVGCVVASAAAGDAPEVEWLRVDPARRGRGVAKALAGAVARCPRDLPHDQAFRAYEAMRRGRVARITAQAARVNRDQAAGPVGRVPRDAPMPLAFKFVDPAKFTWQFDHRIEWGESLSHPPGPARRPAPKR